VYLSFSSFLSPVFLVAPASLPGAPGSRQHAGSPCCLATWCWPLRCMLLVLGSLLSVFLFSLRVSMLSFLFLLFRFRQLLLTLCVELCESSSLMQRQDPAALRKKKYHCPYFLKRISFLIEWSHGSLHGYCRVLPIRLYVAR
jgi:hypothetical protein